eukprot:gene10590-10748_t
MEYFSDEVGCIIPTPSNTVEVTVVGRLHRMYLSPRVTWTEANRICCEAGMKLVEIQDEGHATQLHSAYKAAGGWTNYWLGLNDRAQEGSFTWTTGAGAWGLIRSKGKTGSPLEDLANFEYQWDRSLNNT